jgi:hypothetical protein
MSTYAEFKQKLEEKTKIDQLIYEELHQLNKNLKHFFDITHPPPDPQPVNVNGERLTPLQLSKLIDVSIQTVYSRAAKDSKNPFPFAVSRCGRLLKFNKADVQRAMDQGLV